MSFTVKVKEELLGHKSENKMELSAIIKMSGSLGLANHGLNLSITTENAKIARHIYSMLEEHYHLQPEIKYHQKTNLRKNRVYTVFIEEKVDVILADLKLADAFFGIETGIEHSI
ncbi:DNA-binding protein WhiA, partial [Streptococcus agalactiae]